MNANTVRGFEALPEYADQIKEIEETSGVGFMPQRATLNSAGYDIRTIETVTIDPMQIKMVSTGITAKMGEDEELQLRCRSGLAAMGLSLVNGVGTIDSDYYGKHIRFILINLGSEPITLVKGDRVGQGIFTKYLITQDDQPRSTERKGGFGSSGLK